MDWTNLFAGKSFTLTGDGAVSGAVPLASVFPEGGFAQSFNIDPNNTQHIVMTFHENGFDGVAAGSGGWGLIGTDPGKQCLGETNDGGTTWRLFLGPTPTSGWQEAATVFIIAPTTYVYISANGVYYTANGGSTWAQVQYTTNGGVSYSNMYNGYSGYGGNGIVGPDGNAYLGLRITNGLGVFVSKPSGGALGSAQNWAPLANSPQAAVVISDGISLYASQGIWDSSGQPFFVAPLSNTTNWTHQTNTNPTDVVQGPEQYAYDPIHHALYAACYSGGLMRLQIR